MTHDDFLRAIIENPDEDGPRLVYADLLDERGDPRGEFIRVQCELAGLPEDNPRREELATRERALLAEHREKWAHPLQGLASVEEFRRGFVDYISITAESFLEHADGVLATIPLRQVWLHVVAGRTARLAACPYLGRLHTLELDQSGIVPAGLQELLSSTHLSRLRKLGLGFTFVGRDGLCELLAWSHGLPGLTDLDFGGNDLGAEGIEMLSRSVLAGRLRWLALYSCGLDEAGVRALAAAPSFVGLTCLSLKANDIGDAGAEALAEASCSAGLRLLWLGGNGIGARGVRALVRSRLWQQVVDFDLGNNPLGDAGGEELLAAPRPARLVSLCLRATGMSKRYRRRLKQRFGESVCHFE